MRPIQYFSEEYLIHCKDFSTCQIIEFVEDFRLLFAEKVNQEKLFEQELAYLRIKESLR